jgi:hypothetical protein
MNYCGNQYAGRKFVLPTLIPRPWNGAMVYTDSPYPVQGNTTKKWNRGRSGLQWIWDQSALPNDVDNPLAYIDTLDNWEIRIDTAELRQIAGLWIHLYN